MMNPKPWCDRLLKRSGTGRLYRFLYILDLTRVQRCVQIHSYLMVMHRILHILRGDCNLFQMLYGEMKKQLTTGKLLDSIYEIVWTKNSFSLWQLIFVLNSDPVQKQQTFLQNRFSVLQSLV